MNRYLANIKYIVVHKYYVFVVGKKLGLSFKRRLLHDWHKFLPDEFFPYADYWQGGEQTPDNHRRFKEAWAKHVERSDHHWQAWLHPIEGEYPMDRQPMLEMIADWTAMGLQRGKQDARDWYLHNCNGIRLHPQTRLYVEAILDV